MRLFLVFAVAVAPAVASADVIYLADGTTRQGRVVEMNDKEVVVDFGRGSISLITRIPRASVVRIEKKTSPNEALMSEYVARLGRAVRGGADDWHALGAWCTEQRCLNDKARQAFERAVGLDPGHAAARRALGHVKLNGAWMSRKRAVAILAPTLADDTEAKARELAARKEAEEAKTGLLEAQKQIEELKSRVSRLQKDNGLLRQQLAVPPPPPRVIIRDRPIIIFRDRPRRRERPKKTEGEPTDPKTDGDKKKTRGKTRK